MSPHTSVQAIGVVAVWGDLIFFWLLFLDQAKKSNPAGRATKKRLVN
jgi:hypothetical protein